MRRGRGVYIYIYICSAVDNFQHITRTMCRAAWIENSFYKSTATITRPLP